MLALALFVAGLFGAEAAQCGNDAACRAFEWAYPIWTTANVRWETSAGWGTPNQYTGQKSGSFAMNTVLKRRSRLPVPPTNTTDIPPYTICNATVCSGVNWVLNPSPIVSPNVDTMYGGAWLDTINAMFFQVPNGALLGGARYYSVNFIDAYTNILTTISNENYPSGGLFCLSGGTTTQHTRCSSLAQMAGKTITAYIDLPRYAFALVRVYSTGAPSGNSCGPEGCLFFDQIGIQSIQNNAVLSPFDAYKSYFAPNNVNACSYHYTQKPCVGGNRNAFWDLVCKTLTESPPSAAEADYINNHFSSLGLTTTACTADTLDYTALNAAIDAGWDALTEAEAFVGVAGHQHPNEWLYFPFTGTWDANEAGYLVRGTASKRLHFLVDNHQSAYWAAFTDSRPPKQRTRLSGANNAEYRVEFNPDSDVPVNYAQKGFWSVTLYDSTWFLVNSGSIAYGLRGNTPGVPTNFIISAACNGRQNCVVAPAGPFQLIFRGYYPLAGLDADGGYQLPKIHLCNNGCK